MFQNIKNIFHLLEAFIGHLLFGFPARRLKIIGVTGTSGKTTTAHMIYEVLKAAGFKVSLLSTIRGLIGGQEYDTGLHVTTPGRHRLAYYLRKSVQNGDEYFVLEVSSHSLHQNRVAFIDFDIGVLATLAHEHLDYHKTFLHYAKAKFMLLHKAKRVVIPEDLQKILKGIQMEEELELGSILEKAVTFGLEQGNDTQKEWNLKLKTLGEFNRLNALAAASVGILLGIKRNVVKKALENFSSIPGRFEEIPNKKGFQIIIDFAHKPDALESVLKTARSQVKKNGRVIVMFGAAGNRDKLKRPMMGEIADRLADIVVLTDEDPRSEEPEKIIQDIESGIGNYESRVKKQTLFVIPDRRNAIEFVIKKIARKGDIVLFCGKGHEKSMSYRGVERPWSEREAVEQAL